MKKHLKGLAIMIEDDHQESPVPDRESFPSSLRPHTLPDSDEEKMKSEGGNVVEFEEFLLEDERENNLSPIGESRRKGSHQMPATLQKNQPVLSSARYKRDFLIQIPEEKTTRHVPLRGGYEAQEVREPPAPSHKKMKPQSFAFPPVTPVETANEVREPEPNHDSGRDMQELIKSFDKERQEFYREKSRYQKELLVKEGQIEMLQKMLTGRIGNDSQWSPAQNSQQMEALILEKDLQISELMEKINELSRQLTKRGDELRQNKNELSRLENVNQSLLHQLYLLEKREANNKTTQQFYDLKRQHHHHHKPMTPTERRWQVQPNLKDLKPSGYHEVQRRLDNLKHNRMEFEDRSRIKSEFNNTTKLKPSNFDLSFTDYPRHKY